MPILPIYWVDSDSWPDGRMHADDIIIFMRALGDTAIGIIRAIIDWIVLAWRRWYFAAFRRQRNAILPLREATRGMSAWDAYVMFHYSIWSPGA